MSNVQDEPAEQPRRPNSPWSFQLLKVAGIPIRIHFTFLLLLLWIFLLGGQSVSMVLFMVAIFGCVVLHEFGHALVAKRYGVQTRDITLYPIGGVAMLQGRPKPYQELWIALAGPAVNVVIAIILMIVSLATKARPAAFTIIMGPNSSLIDALYTSNLWLAGFNMIPAFPMDGGRVLRALLGLRLSEARATQIAGSIGQNKATVTKAGPGININGVSLGGKKTPSGHPKGTSKGSGRSARQ